MDRPSTLLDFKEIHALVGKMPKLSTLATRKQGRSSLPSFILLRFPTAPLILLIHLLLLRRHMRLQIVHLLPLLIIPMPLLLNRIRDRVLPNRMCGTGAIGRHEAGLTRPSHWLSLCHFININISF